MTRVASIDLLILDFFRINAMSDDHFYYLKNPADQTFVLPTPEITTCKQLTPTSIKYHLRLEKYHKEARATAILLTHPNLHFQRHNPVTIIPTIY